MALHIVLGFDGPSRQSDPSVLYCGRDGDAARAASEASAARFTKWVRDPKGIIKTNPADAAAADSARFGPGGGSVNPTHAGAVENPPTPAAPEPVPVAKAPAKAPAKKAKPAAPAALEPEIGMAASLKQPRR